MTTTSEINGETLVWPKPGEIWHNNHRKRDYRVTRIDDSVDALITYEPVEPTGEDDGPYQRRLSEWHDLNRDGEVRFTKVEA